MRGEEREDEERRRGGEDENVTKGGGHTLTPLLKIKSTKLHGAKRHSPIEQIIGSIQHTSNMIAPKQTTVKYLGYLDLTANKDYMIFSKPAGFLGELTNFNGIVNIKSSINSTEEKETSRNQEFWETNPFSRLAISNNISLDGS